MFLIVITRSGVWSLDQWWSVSVFWFSCGSHSLVPVLGVCRLSKDPELNASEPASFWSWKPNWLNVAVVLSMARVLLQGMYPLRALQKKIAEKKCKV
jgi:hypothetical protein